MKLLLVHRYIRPDTPGYAHMLYIIGKHFAKSGHDVTIFSAQPGYNDAYDGAALPWKEKIDGMTVIRIPMLKDSKSSPFKRTVNFLWFAFRVMMHAMCRVRAYDLMTVTTFPPALMAVVARFVGLFRKTEYLYHCMDLYPEIAQKSGMLKRSLPLQIAAWIDRQNCLNAKYVVVLSEDMLNTLIRRGLPCENVHVINNFIIDSVNLKAVVPKPFEEVNASKFRVLFAGNIGRFQSLDTIVEAAKILQWNREIEFWFIGAGTAVPKLKEQAGSLLGQSVFFHPYLPIDSVMKVIHRSHLGIVSLNKGVIYNAFPSKTMSYLEAGCKLLCLVENDSSLAKLVERHALGTTCHQPATPEDVAESISFEFDCWKQSGFDRKSIQDAGRANFSQDVILEHWSRLIRGDRNATELAGSSHPNSMRSRSKPKHPLVQD